MNRLSLIFIFVAVTASGQMTDPKPLVEKALNAIGGTDKVLKIFRMKEVFHFGSTPEPGDGKKRSTRESILEMPNLWWIGKKERADEPAKFDVWAWTLGILVDEKSKVETITGIPDEGVSTFGLRVSGSVTPEMKLYFDSQTALLKRLDWRSDTYRFSDWKEHDGVKYASKTIIYKTKDNKPWFYHEVTGLERLTQLPEGLAKP